MIPSCYFFLLIQEKLLEATRKTDSDVRLFFCINKNKIGKLVNSISDFGCFSYICGNRIVVYDRRNIFQEYIVV